MDFRKSIRDYAANRRGIEIGPSYNPILPKAAGFKVYSVDHADQEGLREKYRNDPNVDISRIEPVDAIDDGTEFSNLDEKCTGLDYVVSSHVFEHLPNPIHFLQRCERALKDDGRVIIIVPDKRFCFDALRPVSTAGQMIEAYLADRKTHSAAALYDHGALNARRNGSYIWADRLNGVYSLSGNAQAGYAKAVLADAGEYVDAHGWVFTPSSLRLIFEDLRALGLIGLGEIAFHDTVGPEFMIQLSKSAASTIRDRTKLALAAIEETQAIPVGPEQAEAPYPGYVTAPASHANAVRLLDPSWVAKLPGATGIKAGDRDLIDDKRIEWLIEQVGAEWNTLDILELGPLEASHTATMLQAGARSVLGIEAKKVAYLKCLVVKEILGLDRAKFLLGDFVSYLRDEERQWPLIVASGVLYHMTKPLELLDLLAARTDRLFLWTHVVDAQYLREDDTRRPLLSATESGELRGKRFDLYPHFYGAGHANPVFCGGPVEGPRRMHRDQLFEALELLGFNDLRIDSDDPEHPLGPALSILAQRRA